MDGDGASRSDVVFMCSDIRRPRSDPLSRPPERKQGRWQYVRPRTRSGKLNECFYIHLMFCHLNLKHWTVAELQPLSLHPAAERGRRYRKRTRQRQSSTIAVVRAGRRAAVPKTGFEYQWCCCHWREFAGLIRTVRHRSQEFTLANLSRFKLSLSSAVEVPGVAWQCEHGLRVPAPT
jgi:hypothetical protein